jgi:hypothetical protein
VWLSWLWAPHPQQISRIAQIPVPTWLLGLGEVFPGVTMKLGTSPQMGEQGRVPCQPVSCPFMNI